VEYARGDYAERERASQARQKQMFYGFVIGLMLLGIFFSRSRGGITASLISLTVLISVSKKMRTRGMLLMVAGCWSVMFAYGSIIGFGEILARFDDLDIAASGRSMIWGTALQIIKDHLWTGTGLGSFGELFRVYQTFLDDTAATDYAHNDYLQLMVELGVPVAVSLFVLVWGYWWRTAWRIAGGQRAEDRGQSIDFVKRGELRIRDYAGAGGSKLKAAKRPQAGSWESSTDIRYAGSGSGKRRLIAAGALAGSAAFLVHSWVEFNWQIPADALYLVMLLVIMGEHSREL
jgi:O-antigen ligase